MATNVVMTVAGLTLAATPLALWMSPTKSAFYLTLLICGIAYGVILLLSKFGFSDTDQEQLEPDSHSGAALTPEMIAYLQNQRELSRQELPALKKLVQENIQQPKPPKDE